MVFCGKSSASFVAQSGGHRPLSSDHSTWNTAPTRSLQLLATDLEVLAMSATHTQLLPAAPTASAEAKALLEPVIEGPAMSKGL